MSCDQLHDGSGSSIHDHHIDTICDRFEAAWKSGQRPGIQEHIQECSDTVLPSLLHELLVIDLAYRTKHGETPSRAEYEALFPQHNQVVAFAFSEIETSPGQQSYSIDRPENTSDNSCASKAHASSSSDEVQPTQIDRYRILELLGVGGFGRVYLGYDDQLRRKVAIKVPRTCCRDVDRVDETESFLTEAQILASLDHPNIVNVFDAGQTSDGNCYIVSKWIEGTDLAQVASKERLSHRSGAQLVAKIADALQYAHSRKLVHRDIKPANILIDSKGEPYLADFGLALREDAFGRAGAAGGTAAYMSPEQARGEGHLVDGRSDIFSLAIVLYELLTGERPFMASSRRELLERIKYQDARPPRQLARNVPKELERICLKALSKRATDRYSTAMDFGEDLRHFLNDARDTSPEPSTRTATPERSPEPPMAAKVVPKGLRSFDQVDADFFLELLPGPRDRYGLPESVRFWKSRIEQRNGDETFRVGVIYGPSGCGKSSLVKAGLLPRLADCVRSTYVLSNADNDEQRLLRGLRKQHPGLEPNLDLAETLAAIRRGRNTAANTKTLIVLDQFEQWLHVNARHDQSQLASALRQCDGERLQCLLLVRDDFWMAVSRFMGQLEVPLIEGENSAAVDLFDPLHAEKVLWVFGHAYGRLPDLPSLTIEQESFLRRAIVSLARDDKVIPVRLAVFAEMMKGKPWTLAELKSFGASQVMMMGVTKTFLEETFSSETAPPEHRKHRRAAQAVLRALLPEGYANIKGHKRSRAELLAASEYEDNPQAFADLMRILDIETRLLTPVEPEAATKNNGRASPTTGNQKHYHLTHDYLVQPLREWLTGKQKETRRGRAELMLAERSNLWNSRPESKQLPSLWEWLKIRLLVKRSAWTLPQANMMRAASRLRYRQLAGLFALLIVAVVLWSLRGRSIRVQVEHSRLAWQAGDEEAALRLMPKVNHPAVHGLRVQMFNEGGVTFHLRPENLEFEIDEASETDTNLQLDNVPQVLSGGNFDSHRPRFRSGDYVRLTVGHYVVYVYQESDFLVKFPLFIDRSSYDRAKRERQWTPHGIRQSPTPEPMTDLSRLELAEQVHLTLDVPLDIPAGYVYVNPGPMWHAPDPKVVSTSRIDDPSPKHELDVEIRSHDGTGQAALDRHYLAHGFLIARAETTVSDFQQWWDQLGPSYCEWGKNIYSRVPEAIAETAGVVPRDVQLDCWRGQLEQAGIDVARLEDDEILRRVLQAVQASAESSWENTKNITNDTIANATNYEGPITVSWETAVAYARTHAKIKPAEFQRWVDRMIRDAEYFASQLIQLRDDLKSRTGEFVPSDSLPDTPLVRDLFGRVEAHQYPRPVFDAYCYWLKVRTFYGWQVPILSVRKASPNAAEADLHEATWLWSKSSTQTIRELGSTSRILVDNYAEAIMDGDQQPERQHLVDWLGWMIQQEKTEQSTYENLRDQLEDSVNDAIRDLPFSIRYRYGMHMGWDIPNWKEWEKAFRGADAREYPWGNARSYEKAWLNCWRGGSEPLSEAGAKTPVADVTPYGVSHMAGNLSEWVRVADNPLERKLLKDGTYRLVPGGWNTVSNASHPRTVFLKGGNYVLKEELANAGYSISLHKIRQSARNVQTEWSGFRVIQRIETSEWANGE